MKLDEPLEVGDMGSGIFKVHPIESDGDFFLGMDDPGCDTVANCCISKEDAQKVVDYLTKQLLFL